MPNPPIEINALLGRGTSYDGKLVFEGRVRVDGKLRGEITSDTGVLIVGEGAEIDAVCHVGSLIVRGGTVRGQVRARDLVEVHAPSKVFGDIHAPLVYVDRGAVFEGRCTMSDPSGPVPPVPGM